MDAIKPFLTFPVLLGIAQLIVGALLKPALKKLEQDGKLTGWINAINLVIGLIGFSLVPAQANAASLLSPLIGVGSVFAAALVQNLAVTGVHSTWKNTVRPALLVTIGRLFKK
jgi:cyanate permease